MNTTPIKLFIGKVAYPYAVLFPKLSMRITTSVCGCRGVFCASWRACILWVQLYHRHSHRFGHVFFRMFILFGTYYSVIIFIGFIMDV